MLIKGTRLSALIALLCLAASFGIRSTQPSAWSKEEIAAVVSANLQQELEAIDREAKQIQADSGSWNTLTHFFLLVDSAHILRWNQNDFIPDLRMLTDSVKIRWVQNLHGDYVIKKIRTDAHHYLVGIVPLIERFKISNSFLEPQWNEAVFPASNIQIIDPLFLDSPPVTTAQGNILFRINSSDAGNFIEEDPIAVLLYWAGMIALLIALCLWTYLFYQSGKAECGFLLLTISLFVLRFTSVYFNAPGFYNDELLFNPRFFASSAFNPSIGDLFLNTGAVVILCVYLFFTYSKWKIVQHLYNASGSRRSIIAGICITVGFFTLLFPFLYFETIFHNSSISLDISQSIHFDLIRVVAFLCVAISFVATFCFAHVFFRLFLSLSRHHWRSFLSFLLLGVIILMAYSFVAERNYWITISCGSFYFIALYFFGITRTLKTISYRTFFYFLLILFFFALQGALSIRRFTNEERISSQYRFANEFLVGRDFFGEFLLNETVSKIKEDPFIQTSLANPFLSKASIRQKVRQIHLNNYFDRYDVRIYLYNSVGEPLDSEPFLDFASQVKTYQNKSNTTGYNGIYFTNDPQEQTERKYLIIVPVERSQAPLGYIVMELAMKKVIPRNVYPELLVDNRFAAYLRSRDYSYAIYSNGKRVSTFGEFNYEKNITPSLLSDKALYTTGITINDFTHIGVEDEDERIAIVSSPAYPSFNMVINLSFWMVSGLLFILIILMVQGIHYWIMGERINYSLRVQLYFYSSLLLPLLVVSITTLSVTTRSAATQLNDEYINKSKLLGESLAGGLASHEEGGRMGSDELRRKIRDLARVSDVDATLYDNEGKLIGSSQPLIFDYQFKSEWIDHSALQKIVNEKETSFVKEDHIGALKYYSAFCAIRSPQSGELMGIVSLPFFGSAASLEKTQITILGNILSVFTVVLIVFSIFSLLAADRLTHPLRIIARSLGRTTLTGHNEPLNWNSNDEIGVMVKEYNRMVQNLEQSKIELARTQKESAWREMAKQVAHEIKNPLTPMKLTLQQMEMLLRNEEGIPKERAERSVKSLLSQVEILNEIASSFSTFARMPAPVMIKLDLNTVLKKAVDLYANNDYGKLEWQPFAHPVEVMGDEQLLIRIFSNLILNALQAGEGVLPLLVKVQLRTEGDHAVVSIEDNGKGIAADVKEKIFVPYFTTKKSGSGLGLAIVQQGIEQSRGHIEVTSTEGVGTTFLVQFPLV